jgi:hypothetical protein
MSFRVEDVLVLVIFTLAALICFNWVKCNNGDANSCKVIQEIVHE